MFDYLDEMAFRVVDGLAQLLGLISSGE